MPLTGGVFREIAKTLARLKDELSPAPCIECNAGCKRLLSVRVLALKKTALTPQPWQVELLKDPRKGLSLHGPDPSWHRPQMRVTEIGKGNVSPL